MADTNNQSYEIQVYQTSRWIVHARYDALDRGKALRDAKELDKERTNLAIRVIMEDYIEETGRHKEILVYRNKIDAKAPPKKIRRNWSDMAVSSDGRVGYLADEYGDILNSLEEDGEIKKPKVSFGMFFAILGMIVVVGAASGIIAAGALALLMNAFNVYIEESSRITFLVGMFVVVAIIGSTSSYNYYKSQFDLNPFGKKKKQRPKIKKSKVSEQMEKAAEEIDKVPVKKVEVDTTPEENDSFFDRINLELPKNDEVEKEEFSDEAQQQKMFLINFLGTSLAALKGPDTNEKTLNRFGLNLFMSGAVIRMSNDNDLTDFEKDEILCRILEMLGAKADQAERFALEYEKYLETPRHSELFENAGDIAKRYSDGDQSAPLYIRDTMESWVNWKPPIDENINPNLLTIMFTDMVGSTDLTTKHGDYAAQEVLKAHDLIVRTALTNLEGKEIKHLGDGIMASFKDYDLAVQAAIEIQKRVEGNNNAGPEFPLHVRIGLNAGEPIKKDNDLFGTSVQLAARLCDNAASDCITVSQDLKDLFGDQPVYTFIELGPQQLKGFEEPLPVFQIDWHAPLIEYPEEEEATEDNDEPENVAPDMTVEAPAKQTAVDPDFDSGFPVTETDQSDEGENPDGADLEKPETTPLQGEELSKAT